MKNIKLDSEIPVKKLIELSGYSYWDKTNSYHRYFKSIEGSHRFHIYLKEDNSFEIHVDKIIYKEDGNKHKLSNYCLQKEIHRIKKNRALVYRI